MNQEKTRYLEQHFKMPWVNTLDKDPETEFPMVRPCHVIPEALIRFDKIRPDSKRNRFVSMFEHDGRLPGRPDEPPWRNIDAQAEKLLGFDGIVAPDYSVLDDMDEPAQKWNVYRNRVMSCILRELGHLVIPCVQWADADSFKFCFSSLPRHSVLAVSSVGCLRGRVKAEAFQLGYEQMCERLVPEAIVFNGRIPPGVRLSGPPRHFFDPRTGERSAYSQELLFKGEV